jgi:hypothetical protein
MTQTGTALAAHSVTSGSGWTDAAGAVTSPSTAWMVFNTVNLTARVAASCTSLHWSNSATWTLSQPVGNITTVHAVMMTHLDVGFTLLARDVCEEYFFTHFPNGWALSAALRAAGGPAAYAVTSHPWLVLEFLTTRATAHTRPAMRA